MDFVIFCIFCCFLAPICIFVLFFGGVYEWGDWMGLGNEGGRQKVWVEGRNEKISSLRLAMFENTLFYNQF